VRTPASGPVVAIVGPTASGKSDLALGIARRMRDAGSTDPVQAEAAPVQADAPVHDPGIPWPRAVEVISADSVQLYAGMDIGSGKVSPAERAEIRHHLLDVLSVDDDASVALVQRLAREAIDDCRSRQVMPLVVGGSALYVRAVLDRFDIPRTDPGVRARLEREADSIGAAALHRRLATVDAETAARILPGNVRRVVRALEAIELTGSYSATLPPLEYALGPTLQLGLRLDSAELARRIEARVDRMFADGLVAEVDALARSGLAKSRTARKALGYAQVLDLLAGRCTVEEARAATVAATRRFARRQMQWWRRDPRITWLDAHTDDLAGQAVGLIRRFVADAHPARPSSRS
jgi:tRNA dimethylallyltransferase